MNKISFLLLAALLTFACNGNAKKTKKSINDINFNNISKTWDEGMPLGNAVVGALVWQKKNSLRLSLDRVDLWDLRPVKEFETENYSFAWLYEQWKNGTYHKVHEIIDKPYDILPAPTKIPGAALEFDIESMGEVENVHLFLNNAVCEVKWKNGKTFKTFVHATEPIGWFETDIEDLKPILVAPAYQSKRDGVSEEMKQGQAFFTLDDLGYEQGEVKVENGKITYHQKGWGDFYYDVVVKYKKKGNKTIGVWSISSSLSDQKANAETNVDLATERGMPKDLISHQQWWDMFWAQSSISIPDPQLQKQYYNEMYKFGSATREDSYPISLQAVWTADNGTLPPWKGDFHHDLNTQLSYWPSYTGNYLKEGYGYLNTLHKQMDTYKKYTKRFYGVNGINVPGVATLDGEQMGGWSQYSFSPTVSAWLAQHFYLHWKYSLDKNYLKEVGYPFVKETALFIEEFSNIEDGIRKFPLSSSPEIFDNRPKAWFSTMTNYDLALSIYALNAASEMAASLGLKEEATHWAKIVSEFPEYDVDEELCLTFAKGKPYDESHRHFSHIMAIHPLGLIDMSGNEKEQAIVKSTIKRLDEVGPAYWTGYSYSWLGAIKARAHDGEGAAQALHDFAEYFCLKNTFHANGDQKNAGKSSLTYRPFTLEGNFAFASAIQEMLIQSHTGIVKIFPAIPSEWKDIKFDNLRTFGAFLVSAKMEKGKITEIKITSEKGGEFKLYKPANASYSIKSKSKPVEKGNTLVISTSPKDVIILTLKK